MEFEHALIVSFPMPAMSSGTQEDLFDFEERIEAAITAADAGEFDGDLIGRGECVLYMYGPDADRLFGVVEPLLRASPLTRGGYAVKRYGAAGSGAREERVPL